jgi:peptide/nickel transport system substrate-binding protein
VSVANKTHFNDPQFAELFLKALAEPDLAKRTPLVHAAQRIQYERGGLLVWGYANLLDGVSSRGGAHAEKTLFPTWRFDQLWLKEHA